MLGGLGDDERGNDMRGKTSIQVHYNPPEARFNLYGWIGSCQVGGPDSMILPVEARNIEEGESCQSFMSLQEHEAQELFNSLWQSGLRPTESMNPTKGKVEALQAHVGDLMSRSERDHEIVKALLMKGETR